MTFRYLIREQARQQRLKAAGEAKDEAEAEDLDVEETTVIDHIRAIFQAEEVSCKTSPDGSHTYLITMPQGHDYTAIPPAAKKAFGEGGIRRPDDSEGYQIELTAAKYQGLVVNIRRLEEKRNLEPQLVTVSSGGRLTREQIRERFGVPQSKVANPGAENAQRPPLDAEYEPGKSLLGPVISH